MRLILRGQATIIAEASGDDECSSADCALSALQLRAHDDPDNTTVMDLDHMSPDDTEQLAVDYTGHYKPISRPIFTCLGWFWARDRSKTTWFSGSKQLGNGSNRSVSAAF